MFMELTIFFFLVVKGISEGSKRRQKGISFLFSQNLKNEDETFDIVFTHSSISSFVFISYILYSTSESFIYIHRCFETGPLLRSVDPCHHWTLALRKKNRSVALLTFLFKCDSFVGLPHPMFNQWSKMHQHKPKHPQSKKLLRLVKTILCKCYMGTFFITRFLPSRLKAPLSSLVSAISKQLSDTLILQALRRNFNIASAQK